MKQNSIQYAKLTFVLFIALLIVSSIMYFQFNAGKVNWMDYKIGIERAANENKPILVYPYYTWSPKSKMANQALFSDDDLVELIESKFIPVGLNMDDEENKNIAENQLYIKGIQLSFILDSRGRVITFLDNTSMSVIFKEMALHTLNSRLLSLTDFSSALEEAKAKGKPVFAIVITASSQNNEFIQRLNDPLIMGTIENTFIPTTLMTYFEPDRDLLSNYIEPENLWLTGERSLNHSNLFQTVQFAPPGVVVISPTGELLYQNTIVQFDENTVLDIIEELGLNKNISND